MKFLKEIKEKTILVIPSDIKNKVLEYINDLSSLVQFKIYSLNEIKKYLLFDYDEEAILYLMQEHGYEYEVAKNYIENLYFIEDKDYEEEKLNELRRIKKELDSKGLLTYNNMFENSYKNTPFIVFGYPYLDSFNKKLLSRFNYQVIEKNETESKHLVNKFTTLEDEVLFIVNRIIELINKGVDINKIYLTNLDSNYESEIKRIFRLFNIPIDIDSSSSLMSTSIGKKVYEQLKETKSFESTVEFMKTYDLSNNYNQSIYNSILNILNKYNDLDYSMDVIISAIKYEFLKKRINNNNLDNMVRVGKINSYYNDDEYVFLLGFNQGVVPKIYKDEDYINDQLKPLVGLDSVNEINKLERESTLKSINSIKNLTISYKEHYLDSDYYPSNFINLEGFEKVESNKLETDYSKMYSELVLGKMLDNLIKYDSKASDLGLYYNSINTPYMTYDNSFKGLSKETLYKYLDRKLTLSYSTIDTFYKCQFRYYINNILKLDKYEETFDTLIGSLFHFVLSHIYNDNFDFDREYDYFLKDKEFNNKEQFYLDKLRKELRIVCDRIREFNNVTELKEVFTEKNIKIDKSTDIEVIFKGIVDKIMYHEYNDKTYVAVIDYKTGHADIDITNSCYGLGMQLIIYLYLISKSDLFDNYSFVGFYLQKILSNEVNIEKDKTYLELKNDNMKLYGYSNSDPTTVERFDPTFAASEYIRGLKTKKDGDFDSRSKVIDEETMNKLINLVDKKIDEARDKVLDADFRINPKGFYGDAKPVGCEFCKFYDICFRKNEDIVNNRKVSNLSFLEEGDDNE